MNEKWYKDIMIQRYQFDTYYDPTKLFVLYALVYNEGLKKTYSLREISKIVYRLYISNPQTREKNVNNIIRHLSKYGITDLEPIICSNLCQWMREQQYDSIIFKNDEIKLNLEDYGNNTVELTRKMCNMLFKKYYKGQILPPIDLKKYLHINDQNIDEFGISIFKQRAMEDYQYCPLCENVEIENLRVVRILNSKDTDDIEILASDDNLLLMCKEEAIDYLDGKFYFDEFGKVLNISSKLVNKNMRLSIKHISKKKKEILKMKQKIMENI